MQQVQSSVWSVFFTIFSQTVVFLCFHFYLVSVLFTGPYLCAANFLQKIFTPSFCYSSAAWQQTHSSVPALTYCLSLSRSTVVLINFNISIQISMVSTFIAKRLQHVGRCYGLQQLFVLIKSCIIWQESRCLVCSTVIN